MTTATVNAPAVKLTPVVVYWKGDNIAITAGSRTCKIDQTHFDSVSFSDDADAEYTRLNTERKGRAEFATAMTRDQMLLWVEIRDTLAKYRPEESKPAEEIPTTVIETPTPVEEKPAPAVAPLPSLANHTVTVTIPEGGEEYIGGPTVRKKRQRKTDQTVLDLYNDVNGYCRAVGLDDMERRISQLERAKDFANGKIKRMTYDIPTVIRAEIIEPTRVLRCCGPMPTESECLMRESTVDGEMFQRFKGLLDRYKKGTPNAARLGTFLTYRISSIAYEDVNDLRETVSEALDAYLIKCHTSLINALAKADEDLKKAMGGENKTLNDMEKAQCGRDNAYRSAIVKAHEALNIALRTADRFDLTMETVDLIKAHREALVSQRNSFNAECAKRGAKPVEI
jgi:hypothetical protein